MARHVISTLLLVAAACGDDDGRAGSSPFGTGAGNGSSASGTDTDDPGSTGGGTSGGSGSADGGTTEPSGTTTAADGSTSGLPTTATETATTGEQPLPCDPEFAFDPPVPTSASFFVETTHPEPLAFINLTMTGPNVVEPMFLDVVAEDPWSWRFSVDGHGPGVYLLEFGNAASEGGPVTVHSTCQLQINE